MTRDEVRDRDWSLHEALGVCGWPDADVAEVLADIQGANDERPWHWLLMLEDGTFAYVTGSCDYTGWG